MQSYPWLSIQEGEFLDPHNPYTELFKVSNGGYIPLTNLSAACNESFESGPIVMKNNTVFFPNFASYLGHDSATTIPCFAIVYAPKIPEGAKFEVRIEYAYYHINFKRFRRHQSFHFKSIKGKDGLLHWLFLAP